MSPKNKKKRPALFFYVGDILKDPAFLLCDWQAQNLWIRMLLHLHELDGIFRLGDHVLSDEEIAKLCHMPIADLKPLLWQLEANGVSARIAGALANRRIVRERQVSVINSKNGKHGAEVRWRHHSQADSEPIANSIAANRTSSSSSSSSPNPQKDSPKSHSSPNPRKDSPKSVPASEFLTEFRTDEFYANVNIDLEYEKAKRWAEKNHRKVTPKMFTNWLNRAKDDLPLQQPPARPTCPVLPEIHWGAGKPKPCGNFLPCVVHSPRTTEHDPPNEEVSHE